MKKARAISQSKAWRGQIPLWVIERRNSVRRTCVPGGNHTAARRGIKLFRGINNARAGARRVRYKALIYVIYRPLRAGNTHYWLLHPWEIMHHSAIEFRAQKRKKRTSEEDSYVFFQGGGDFHGRISVEFVFTMKGFCVNRLPYYVTTTVVHAFILLTQRYTRR